MLKIELKPLENFKDLALPAYETSLAAGVDMRAAIDDDACRLLSILARASLVPTGLAMALPAGYEAQIRPRSGLAYKHGITVVNSPGTIDADYRGEVKILLINHGGEPFTIARGDRIAQMVIAPVTQARFESVENLSNYRARQRRLWINRREIEGDMSEKTAGRGKIYNSITQTIGDTPLVCMPNMTKELCGQSASTNLNFLILAAV